MNKFVLAAALLASVAIPPAHAATEISVEAIGSIFNESLALPANDAPGSGIAFEQFFQFSLPTKETVTVSMSDSAIGNARVLGGILGLDTQTSIGPGPLFIPAGTLLESTPFVNALGGQSAELNPDILSAGTYFAEISGTSGSSPIHIAIDGTVTATQAVPEPGTWALMGVGFAILGLFGYRQRKATRFAF
jgi:hypothetical protein